MPKRALKPRSGAQRSRSGPARKRRTEPARKPSGRARPVRPVKPAAPEAPELKPVPAPVLSTRERRELRGRAHGLEPVVQVGHNGVSKPVIEAVNRALRDHELIKVRLHEPEDKREMAAALATGVRAALCGLVGHTVILYRPNPRKPKRAGSNARA